MWKHHITFTNNNTDNHQWCCKFGTYDRMLLHSNQSFRLFTFWFWTKFFSSVKNQIIPESSGCLSLFRRLLTLVTLVLSDNNCFLRNTYDLKRRSSSDDDIIKLQLYDQCPHQIPSVLFHGIFDWTYKILRPDTVITSIMSFPYGNFFHITLRGSNVSPNVE